MAFKSFMSQASSSLNRAVQLTEEKIGSAERTEYPLDFMEKFERADKIKLNTEKMVSSIEVMLQPNPALRAQSLVMDNIQKEKTEVQLPVEQLGYALVEGGNVLGCDTSYGKTLISCGHADMRLGSSEKDYGIKTKSVLLEPLKKFLNTDMKSLQKERSTLDTRRLDLDSLKTKLKKVSDGPPKQNLEADLQRAQSQFDQQLEITRVLLDGVVSSNNRRPFCEFVEAQVSYYAQCHQIVQDLQREINN